MLRFWYDSVDSNDDGVCVCGDGRDSSVGWDYDSVCVLYRTSERKEENGEWEMSRRRLKVKNWEGKSWKVKSSINTS